VTEEPEDQQKGKKRPRSRARRWALRLILLCAVLWAINGPVARQAAAYGIGLGLEKQGLEGDMVVEGTLWTGLTLRNADYTGNQGIQVLKFSEVGLSYRLPDLIDLKIEQVVVRDLHLVLDQAKFPPKEETEEPLDLDQIREMMATGRDIFNPIDVQIHEVLVEVLNGGEFFLSAGFESLTHETGSNDIVLGGFHAKHAETIETAPQQTQLTWTDDRLTISRIEVLPEIGVSDVSVSLLSGDPLNARAMVQLFDAHLDLKAPTFTKFSLKMDRGELDLARVMELAQLEQKVTGKLTDLEVAIEDWRGNGRLRLADLEYEEYSLKLADISVVADQQLASAEIKLANESQLIDVKAQLPFEGVVSLKDLEKRTLHVEAEVPALKHWSYLSPQPLPNGALRLVVDYPVGTQEVAGTLAFTKGDYGGKAIPQISGDFELVEQQLHLGVVAENAQEKLQLKAEMNLESQDYQMSGDGSISLQAFVPALEFTKSLTLKLKGEGSLRDQIHNVDAAVSTGFVAEGIKTDVEAQIEAKWPLSVIVPKLTMITPDGGIEGKVSWIDELLTVDTLAVNFRGERALSLSGEIPAPLKVSSLDDLMAISEPIDLSLVADEFSLSRFQEYFPVLKSDIEGNLNGKFVVGGTFAAPRLDGAIEGKKWLLKQVQGLKPIDFSISTSTDDQELSFQGLIQEGGAKIAKVEGLVPLAVADWVKKTKSVETTPISLKVNVDRVNLQRFREVVPQLTQIDGAVSLDLEISGMVSDPSFQGTAGVEAKKIKFNNERIPDLRDSHLKLSFEQRKITILPSSFTGSGGKFNLSGTVDLEGESPAFNVRLKADKALVWRDDSVSMRCDTDLALSGNLEKASLTGKIALAESLFYKDIELIPFGVPAGSVPTPQLPKLGGFTNSTKLPIPEPFSNWTVDLGFSTADPVLIRGNLATGEVHLLGRVTGVLAEPRITLNADLKDTVADLPLSELRIKRGKASLRPGEGFIPTLNIRGESTIGQHQIYIYVYGKATSPTLVFTSSPPLPESEVLTLLATGTTTAGLEDQQVASMKAFQLLLSEMRRKYAEPGQNKTIGKLLDAVDQVDLRVGDDDPYSGRKFNSATLQLSSRWHASAGFDAEGNSRGILIYALRY